MDDAPLDIYAPLNHVYAMRHCGPNTLALPGQYRRPEDLRRFTAYRVLDALRNNATWQFLDPSIPEAKRRENREYGDPNRYVARIVDGVLSDQMMPLIGGAGDPPLDAPPIPPKPEPAGEDADEIEATIAGTRLRVWTDEAQRILDEWLAHVDTYQRARTVQDQLTAWWHGEQMESKIYAQEATNVVPLGDGVYALGLDDDREPTVVVYEPDAYCPVDPGPREFPDRAHLQWVEDRTNQQGKTATVLTRITYWLAPIVEGDTVEFDADGRPSPVMTMPTPDGPVADRPILDGQGEWQLLRTLPYDGQMSTVTCLRSHMEWTLGADHTWGGLDPARATVIERAKDLGPNFLPVIHQPNTPTSQHFGVSSLMHSHQLWVDIGQSDRDLATNAGLAAAPIVTIPGLVADDAAKLRYGQAAIWSTPVVNGQAQDANVLDLGKTLAVLLKYNEQLRDLAATVGGVPNAVLGKLDRDIAGVTVKLLLGPFEQMIKVLRITRQQKLSLLVKMWQRMAMIGGTLEPGPTLPASIAFGPITPTDVTGVIEQVAKLLAAHAISRATALRMLTDAGLPVGDAVDELERIAGEDFAGAKELAEAMADESAAADYLGREVAERPPPVLPDVRL